MDSFSKRLSKIDRKMPEPLIEREEGERAERKRTDLEIDRKTMFENAPKKNKDFIISERKSWWKNI